MGLDVLLGFLLNYGKKKRKTIFYFILFYFSGVRRIVSIDRLYRKCDVWTAYKNKTKQNRTKQNKNNLPSFVILWFRF